jgi:Rad3-related DNA helicase
MGILAFVLVFVAAIVATIVLIASFIGIPKVAEDAREELEKAQQELEESEEIQTIQDAISNFEQDIREGANEVQELLERTTLDEKAEAFLENVRREIEEHVGDTQPALILDRAVALGNRFGERFPDHVEDVKKELVDLKGELDEASEFTTMFVLQATSRAEQKQQLLPQDFPFRSVFEREGVLTVKDVRELDDVTDVKGIGPSRAEDVREALENL